MAGKISFVIIQHACQVALSFYGAACSYVAITNLQKYEATTKKLAKWSSEVESHLNRTRTTQATGALAVGASLIVSCILLLVPHSLPRLPRFLLSPAMLVAVLLARGYIKNYWTPKTDSSGKPATTKVPLPNMEDYNEAQKKTEDLLQVLEYLEYSWVISSLVAGMIGYK